MPESIFTFENIAAEMGWHCQRMPRQPTPQKLPRTNIKENAQLIITQATSKSCPMPEGKTDHIVFCEKVPGFGLRIRNGGRREHRTFIAQVKIGKKQRRIGLGNVNKVTADAARTNARQMFALVAMKRDPVSERAKASVDAVKTFDLAVDDYLAFAAGELRASSLAEATRSLKNQWSPFNSIAITGIDKPAVKSRLDVLRKPCLVKGRKRGGVAAANRGRAWLSAFFSWAVDEGRCDFNPVQGTRKRKEQARERLLSATELVAIWTALPHDDYGDIIRLLMLTGQRRTQITKLTWNEVDLENRRLVWDRSRIKNNTPQEIFLARTALAILQSIPRHADCAFVFGKGKNGFGGLSRGNDALRTKLQIPHWTPHDLRRALDTALGDQDVPPHVLDEILSHKSQAKSGVKGIYRKSLYLKQRQAALERWDDYLMTLVAQADGTNVIPLKSSASAPLTTDRLAV